MLAYDLAMTRSARTMTLSLALAAAVSASGALGQQKATGQQEAAGQQDPPHEPGQASFSLRDRIPMPLVYIAVEPREDQSGSPLVEQLLGHPALKRLVGDQAAGPAVAVLRRFLSRTGAAMELALTDIRAGGRPEMLFRGVLSDEDATTLGAALRRNGPDANAGSIGGHPVYRLATSSTGAGPQGGSIEAVLAGRELLVSNDRFALESVLDGETRSVSSLAVNPVYQRLSGQLADEESEVSAFVDWARLRRLVSGQQRELLSWSGLRNASAVMAALRSFDGGVATVALVDRGDDGAAAADPESAGWLSLLKPMPPRVLARSFPRGGVFSVLLAADPERLAESGVGGGEFAMLRRALTDGCGGLGLSFDNQVLKRLAGTGALRMMMVPGERGLEPVWSLRARSRSAATDLFDDLRRAVVQAGLGERQRERGQPERLLLFGGGERPVTGAGGPRGQHHPSVFGPAPLVVSTAAESLLFARTQQAIDAAQAAGRKRGPDLLSTWTDAGFDRNATDVVGMLLLDVSSLLEPDELDGFPTHHVGAIRIDDDHVRVEVVSPH